MSRVMRELREPLQNALDEIGAEVHHEGGLSLVVSTPEGAEEAAERIITNVLSDRLMDSIHGVTRPMLSEQGMIKGGRFTPPVPRGEE